jgi:SP family general alpha glucoside:H+ symporter-like MFS transporter
MTSSSPTHPEGKFDEKLDTSSLQSDDIALKQAKEAASEETSLTLIEGIRKYPNAVLWSVFLSTTLIMEGYDVALLNSFFAFPSFTEKYGYQLPDGKYEIPAAWQAGLSNGIQCGEIIGLIINGWVSERYGYRKTMIGALSAITCLIFIPFFAPNIKVLLAGLILQGVPWGIFQTLATAYASEVCPVPLRAYLTSYVNLCWVMGQLIASGVLKALLTRTDQWGYRIPYALQWMWPVPLIIGTIFAPESPWWLVRQNRIEDAKQSVRRLTSADAGVEDQTVAMMVNTNNIEMKVSSGTSFFDCFTGLDLRRTEITCVVWIIQQMSGAAFMNYSTYFLQQAGLKTADAFSLTMGQFAIGFVGTIGSWFLLPHFRRRNIYIMGLLLQSVLMMGIGIAGIPKSTTASSWSIGGLLLAFTAVYDLGVGPVCYALVAEISSTRLRAKTIVLARAAYCIAAIINSTIVPLMLATGSWNWGGKTGFFWCGTCLIAATYCFFRLPDPTGRTYGEMDLLFEKGVSLRKFQDMDVDEVAGTVKPKSD